MGGEGKMWRNRGLERERGERGRKGEEEGDETGECKRAVEKEREGWRRKGIERGGRGRWKG